MNSQVVWFFVAIKVFRALSWLGLSDAAEAWASCSGLRAALEAAMVEGPASSS